MTTRRISCACIRHLLLILLVIALGGSAFAQLRIVGAISGIVQDPSGASVSAARVVLRDEATGITRGTITTVEGNFLFPDLAAGSYEVTVTMTGFQTYVANHVSVSTSQTTDVKISLKVGEQVSKVTVEGVAPVLETTSLLVTTTQTAKTVNELPLAGRNTLALARLMPGASPPAGGSTRYNNLPGGAVIVTLDGINDASNGFKSGGTVFYMTVPSRLGAVDEISVETGGLGADSGAQSGANIKFVTRRGGNHYHGSAFYQPSSEQFNANTWSRNAQGLPRVYNRQHEFGGNFSGPLVPFGSFRQKLFVFFNFERIWQPVTNPRTFDLMTPAAQRGDFTYLVSGTTNQLRTANVLQLAANQGAPTRLDPVVQSIMANNNQVPKNSTPVAGTDFNRDRYTWNAENNNYVYYPTVRLDYHLTQKHQLIWVWNYWHNWQAGERRLPIPDINRTNPFRLGYYVWSAALQSSLTPRMFNEFRYGTQHSGDTNTSAANGVYYTYNGQPLRIGGALPFGNADPNVGYASPLVPFIDQQNTTGRHFITTIYDTLTLTRGEHTITVGGSFRKTAWKDAGEVFQIPTYGTGTPSGDPLPGNAFTTGTLPGINSTELGNVANLYNALTGRVSSANFTRVVNPDTLKYDGNINFTWTESLMGGMYVQDRWRMKRTLTLNYGLRWEAQGPMHDTKGITAVPDLQSLFGPSVALFSPGTLSGNNNPTVKVGAQAYKADYRNFNPNFGFAWNPNSTGGRLSKLLGGSKTVIRGSFGIVTYDEGTQMFAANLGPNAGKFINANIIPGQGVLPRFYALSDVVANPLTASAFTFANTTYATTINQADQTFVRTINGMNPDLRAPYTENWTLGIQREMMKNTVLEVRYVGNAAHRAWRTSNLNEVDIFNNGFLQEFKNAQNNLSINRTIGVTNSFANRGLPGQVPLPIFDAAFGARGSVAAIAAGSGYGSATFISNLDNGEAGSLAGTLAFNENYVCRMFGNSLRPCTTRNPGYSAPGVYPINFFVLNPYVAGKMNYTDDTGWNSYNGLQVQFRKRYTHGLDWTANYTWSKSLTNLHADNAQQSVDWKTLRNERLDHRVSQFDIRHVVQTYGTYDLPVGKGRKMKINNRILDGVIGGWTTGSILVFNTGQPVIMTGGFGTVNTIVGSNTNAVFGGVNLAPGVTLSQIQDMFNADKTRLVGRAGTTDLQRLAVDSALIGPDGRANPAFLVPNRNPGQLGGFLVLRDRNTFSWNASLTKTFVIREGLRFQFYASANNVLNHPSWGFPNANVFSTSFGVVGAPGGNRTTTFRGTFSF